MANDPSLTVMPREALLDALGPIRLPETGGVAAELALCLILGLCVGLAIDGLLARRAGRGPSLAERLAALARLRGEERRLGLLYLLRDLRPAVLRGWGDRLYRRGALPDSDEIEAELRRDG